MDTINEFPVYTGFGRLNPKTVSESTDEVSADYFFQDKPVYRITHNTVNGSWQMKDIFEDKGNLSSAKDLKSVVLQHFNYLDCKTNPIFNFVRDKICSLGNIYFENLASMNDKRGVASYFPAGRLVIVRLPIFFAEKGLEKVDIIENKMPYLEEEKRFLLGLYKSYNTSILVSEDNGKASAIPVLMCEFLVTLASLFDVVDWICTNNLISPDKIFRLIIQDSNTVYEHSIQKFEAINEDDVSYIIIFEGMDDSKIKFEEFEKIVVHILLDEMNSDKT
ncbi:MAG TPA: hypothetical protein VLR29_10780 [Flavobacterium sp.]|nr:hypothetical protein [Flavobacterium sp.]